MGTDARGPRTPTALTIAGSDSGGGAGIQADLKTFAALGVYGTSAVTAITAQNTVGVRAVEEMSSALVAAQIDAVLEDIGADVAKTGMLASAAIIAATAERLRAHGITRLVVDPVMVAKSGDRLLRADAVHALQTVLLPLALVVTPNLPEAETLAGMPIGNRATLEDAARRIAALGPRYVLIKGGHASGDPVDILFDGYTFREYVGARIATTSTHGTGCTLSAAIAAYLARGLPVEDAVGRAKGYVEAAMRAASLIGRGHGPLHHLFTLSEETPLFTLSEETPSGDNRRHGDRSLSAGVTPHDLSPLSVPVKRGTDDVRGQDNVRH